MTNRVQLLSSRLQILVIMGLVLLFDQGVKKYIQSNFSVGHSVDFIPNVFRLTLTYNKGAAFSLFKDYPQVLLIVTILIILVFTLYCFNKKSTSSIELMGYGLILGGACGNLIDRVILGKVVDYLDFVLINYPIFNLADSFIFIGVILLIWHQLNSPVVD